jgi:uncharacterized membrane protein
MTASKSSRTRNARTATKGSATRNGGTATGRTGTADKTAAVKDATVATPTGKNARVSRNDAAARSGSATRSRSTTGNGSATRSGGSSRGAAARNGGDRGQRGDAATLAGTARRVSRGRPVQEDVAEAAPRLGPALWMQLTTLALALAGLGVSTYLTVAHFTESTLAGCGETSGRIDCTKVTTSAQSYVFGIPVAVLGMAFYVFLVAIMSPWAWRAARREIHLLRIASMVVGIGFVIYLLYAELYIIDAICLYCTSVHVLTFVLFVLTVFAAAAWGLVPRRQPS